MAASDHLRTFAWPCQEYDVSYDMLMKKLIRLIDQDVVASLNNGRHAVKTTDPLKKFTALLIVVWAPRLTWVKLIAPLLALPIPLIFLGEPMKTYWLLACLTAILLFFVLYFYRLALIRQRWLDKHHVDEFGATSASPDDLYEAPSD